MFDAEHLIELIIMGWLANVPLAIGSIWTLSIFGERWWKLSRENSLKVYCID